MKNIKSIITLSLFSLNLGLGMEQPQYTDPFVDPLPRT